MATINEDYCSYEVAKLLKEKGFNESIRCWYDNFQDFHEEGVRMCNNDCIHPTIMCPTLQMAMKWLREVHHIHVCPEYNAFFQERPKKIYHHWCNKIIGIGKCFRVGIQDLNELDFDYFYHRGCKTCHDTFEEACEEAIKYSLENLI